jgi:hypothetical protein
MPVLHQAPNHDEKLITALCFPQRLSAILPSGSIECMNRVHIDLENKVLRQAVQENLVSFPSYAAGRWMTSPGVMAWDGSAWGRS